MQESVDAVLKTDSTPVASCTATSAQSYTVVSGDTLTTIGDKYSVGPCDLAKANSISNPNLIVPGQALTIPAGICTADSTSCQNPPTTATATCTIGGPNSYLIRSGDTGTTIAANFNITLPALIAANPSINIDVLAVNQLLNIPVCDKTKCSVETYTIKSGDTFFDLAAAEGSTVGQVLASNQGLEPTTLAIGQQILLPKKCRSI
ncbi:Intracellular hyphae protein 1-like protein 2 [Phlyctema vagabunda]|uniref:Intracellular hyphae protein 1-like protein 2 n=1 Tax=Phlyctema vagabunda TaxID=108571 RepID=A0ABR4PQX5_9HELO